MAPDSTVTGIIGEVLRVLQGLGVVPWWSVMLAAILVAIAVVVLRHFSPWAAIKRGLAAWAKAATPPPDPVEHPPSSPMDMPPDGMPVPGPGDRWKPGGEP